MPIEAIQPLDLTDEQAVVVTRVLEHAETRIKSSTALAIFIRVAGNTVTAGESTLSHGAFGRMTGQCRRSIDTAIKRLKGADLIYRVGTTIDGRAIYRANLTAGLDAHGVD